MVGMMLRLAHDLYMLESDSRGGTHGRR